ncbi:hypothetical protein LNV23_18905 [Paucibacter sp. DJ1R-11]|uniref:hypothetical protein n=1 Tax=Paucibacter sp. DJ1R-11 TaxID=2893556 RepID=UPI0021E50B1F|nr:hypothetical protein [Paucibacter sp. DJ1R-11]MCV2365523.1 hypothetical protein [Paucibacter sp. DJ1R-11]
MLNVVSQFFSAPDKLAHMKAGSLAALFGAALGAAVVALLLALLGLQGVQLPLLLCVVLMLVCAAVGSLATATAAGIAKERADQADNLIYPGMHGVEVADAVATGLPGLALCVVLCVVALQLSEPLVAPWVA